MPGAVWELPERAKAYLLDLLQGGGVKLHIDFIDLIYRTIHDLSEAPRTSFGDNPRALSGVALEMELHPLLQRVRQQIVWGPVLPQDRGRLVREEQLLVSAGIHSRRTAMEALGVPDADKELRRVREEG